MIPNWIAKRFKSGEECMMSVISTLMSQGKRLVNLGLGGELTFSYKGNTFICKENDKKRKKDA